MKHFKTFPKGTKPRKFMVEDLQLDQMNPKPFSFWRLSEIVTDFRNTSETADKYETFSP